MPRLAPIKRAFSKLLIQIPILLSVHSVPPSVLIQCQYAEAAEHFETRGSSSSTQQYAYPCSGFQSALCIVHWHKQLNLFATYTEALPGGGGSHVAHLNFKTSRVRVYRCLLLIVSLPSLSQFGRGRLSLIAISFYALSLLFGPCRLSE